MKSEKLKRNFWNNAEIECMLSLLRDVYRIQGTTQTTNYTFIQIASKMKRKGFPNKAAAQIRRKWFQMKSAYLCYKRGNTERLLLIPERFRPIIAEFVDREPKIQQFTELPPSPEPVVSPSHTSQLPPQQQQLPPLAPRSVQAPARSINNSANNLKSTSTASKPSMCNDESQMAYVGTNYEDFLSHVKQTHRIISKDFMNMQKMVMDFEHSCQKERDAKLVSFIRSIKYDF
ncbi:uncharacterized protein [Eurosta solidaginis]|uniref:uncharacterized protein isoform X2 n=1 Tax=Eurosta solidaginis TaxID=178769 RepID=UPI003530A45C